MQAHEKINLDITYGDFEYAITRCLERCETEADCERLVPEILRVMKIRMGKAQKRQNKVNAMAHARLFRNL